MSTPFIHASSNKPFKWIQKDLKHNRLDIYYLFMAGLSVKNVVRMLRFIVWLAVEIECVMLGVLSSLMGKGACMAELGGVGRLHRRLRRMAGKSEALDSSLKNVTLQTWSRSFSFDSDGDVFEVVVPFMGESITDGTLATFLKIMFLYLWQNVSKKVEVDEPIAQIDTDKVTIDVNSPEAGVIKEFVAKEGDTIEPGAKIGFSLGYIVMNDNTSIRVPSEWEMRKWALAMS
ncbi:dihydrolipoyllysine-residue succinyltransferase [Salvia divinorum]|uniref:Dihydrolipoyllysine-residue succinyltransferase n=1 Tax=Salvia divinorum TaxID=28513 RepID=A0ABD1ID78_SALDI